MGQRRTRVGLWGALVALLAALLVVPPAAAMPRQLAAFPFRDDFETGTLANWSVTVNGASTARALAGAGLSGSRGARLTTPAHAALGSVAYLTKSFDLPMYGVSASGDFNVLADSCALGAGGFRGITPFFRLFDTSGARVVSLYRIAGNCAAQQWLYVQYSGNFYRVNLSLGLNQWTHLELRATVAAPGQSVVQVYVGGQLLYATTIADNGSLPFGSIVVGNDTPNQASDLEADNVYIANLRTPAPPPNPCDANAAPPTNTDPGLVVLADNFESYGLSHWSSVTLNGGATAIVQGGAAHAGACAARVNVPGDSTSRANLTALLPSGTHEVWADGWFNVQAAGASADSNVPLFRFFSGDTRVVDLYRQNDDGELYLRIPDGAHGWSYIELEQTLDLNAWHRVQAHVVASPGGSVLTVWLDGTQLYTSSAATLGVASLTSVLLYSDYYAQEGTLLIDDVVIKVGD